MAGRGSLSSRQIARSINKGRGLLSDFKNSLIAIDKKQYAAIYLVTANKTESIFYSDAAFSNKLERS